MLFTLSFFLISACVAANDIAVNFTKVPKNTEFFVGTEAILQWEYSSSLPADPVRKIKFGIQENENTDVAIFVKDVSRGNVKTNTKIRLDVIAPLNGRVHVIENKTATFRIANLTLNDSKRYFCTLEVGSDSPWTWTKTHYVDVRVVGKWEIVLISLKYIPDLTFFLKNEYRPGRCITYFSKYFLII